MQTDQAKQIAAIYDRLISESPDGGKSAGSRHLAERLAAMEANRKGILPGCEVSDVSAAASRFGK